MDVKKGEMKVKFKKGNEPIDWEGICDTDKEVNFCVRLEVFLVNLREAQVYLTMVPLSLEEIKDKAEEWEIDILGDRLPMAVLKTGTSQAIKKASSPAKLMVQESVQTKAGFGIFPLIEQVFSLNIWSGEKL